MECDCGRLMTPRLAKTRTRVKGRRLVTVQYVCSSCGTLKQNNKWEDELAPGEISVWQQRLI
jgi:NMD protein affecting ribosome stability and mRNA decay